MGDPETGGRLRSARLLIAGLVAVIVVLGLILIAQAVVRSTTLAAAVARQDEGDHRGAQVAVTIVQNDGREFAHDGHLLRHEVPQARAFGLGRSGRFGPFGARRAADVVMSHSGV
jgi:hypothetical protein